MVLIIAEKPLTAEPIAANRKASTKHDGYFEGNGYIVTSAFGHLVELFEPEDYDPRYKTWSLQDLPIIPRFQYKIQDEPYRKKRFHLIKKLLAQADEIINACDSDREGESIFWQILKQAGFKDFHRCKRLWISDYNDGPITQAFNHLKPLMQFQNEYLSAEARQKADWLYGMNLSRLLTKSAVSGQWIFGRVQTPTLMIVCDAYRKHHEFKETPYWKVRIDLQKASHTFFALNDNAIATQPLAEQFLKSIPDQLRCTKSEVTDKKEPAPLLFNLSALQQEAGKAYNLKMDQTLAAAQSLYEKHRLTTYPRTDSRHLPESLRQQVLLSLKTISVDQRFPEVIRTHARILAQGPIQGPFNDSKVSSHHAIIPTTESSTGKTLTPVEEKVYILIIKQFIQALMPPCEKKLTRLEFAHGADVFKASGATTIKQGWRAVEWVGEKSAPSAHEEPDELEQPLPEVKEGEILKIHGRKILEKKTKKPGLLTTASLSRLMATAGKLVENEELSQAMKDCGLGTEATRADIVKRLYELNYIEDQGKFIAPTANGLQLYEILKDARIASPELTGVFESKLHQVARGQLTQELFLQEAAAMMIDNMKGMGEKARILESQKHEKESLDLKCPKCKQGEVVIGAKTYHCSLAKWTKTNDTWNNSGCTFQLFKTLAGKKLSPATIRQLLTTRTTKSIPGFTSKSGKKFSAKLKLSSDLKIEFLDS
ncbi:MAG TPA: DNA topoisomerase [Chryseosolibacter sp.]